MGVLKVVFSEYFYGAVVAIPWGVGLGTWDETRKGFWKSEHPGRCA